MPLLYPRYEVWVTTEDTPDPVRHEVTVTHGDQLRAELEGPRHGLRKMQDAPLHYTTLWCWCALVRTGAYSGPFQQFKNDVAQLDPITDPAGDHATVTEDPTPPGP